MEKRSFGSLASVSAVLAAVFGLLYSLAFVVLKSDVLSALFLLLGGLAMLVVITALYHLQPQLACVLCVTGVRAESGAAARSLIHGGYDLSNALHPLASLSFRSASPIRSPWTPDFRCSRDRCFLVVLADDPQPDVSSRAPLPRLRLSTSVDRSVSRPTDRPSGHQSSDPHPCRPGRFCRQPRMVFVARRGTPAPDLASTPCQPTRADTSCRRGCRPPRGSAPQPS